VKTAALVRQLPALLLAACLCFLMQPTRSEQAAPANPSNRALIHFGMWTLLHDHELKLSPAPEEQLALTTCDSCAITRFSAPVVVRAAGEMVTVSGPAKSVTSARIAVRSAAMLSAHNESVSLHNPVTITARNGTLVIAVTLSV